MYIGTEFCHYHGVVLLNAGDLQLLDTTKDLIHGALSSPHAGRGLANGEALDQQADDEFSSEVSAAIVDWIAKRMSDYHKNFHDTQLMQVLLTHNSLLSLLLPYIAWKLHNLCMGTILQRVFTKLCGCGMLGEYFGTFTPALTWCSGLLECATMSQLGCCLLLTCPAVRTLKASQPVLSCYLESFIQIGTNTPSRLRSLSQAVTSPPLPRLAPAHTEGSSACLKLFPRLRHPDWHHPDLVSWCTGPAGGDGFSRAGGGPFSRGLHPACSLHQRLPGVRLPMAHRADRQGR